MVIMLHPLLKAVRLLSPKKPILTPMLQEFFFRQSLVEMGVWGGKIKIDHINGRSHHSFCGWVPIVFPNSLILLLEKIPKVKYRKFFFRGSVYPGREWLFYYPDVSISDYGRNNQKKYSTDYEYYSVLSGTEFGLSPTGDCPWSYRFFEAIICHAIPVLGPKDNDVYSDGFYYFRHGDHFNYSDERCRENYRLFLERHTLRGIISPAPEKPSGKSA